MQFQYRRKKVNESWTVWIDQGSNVIHFIADTLRGPKARVKVTEASGDKIQWRVKP